MPQLFEKKLLPVTQMDQGFIFPEYPEQVMVSYWQGGTICDYIASAGAMMRCWGWCIRLRR